ncbi:MAG: site-specific integrase [Hyphomonadaceae bacterium]|nr:site-specific integrase [Hyphomonadaceae bacterium]
MPYAWSNAGRIAATTATLARTSSNVSATLWRRRKPPARTPKHSLSFGCWRSRRGEIINLSWNEVDFDKGMLRLRDSKSGQKVIPVGKSALAILTSQPRTADSGLIFPADKLGRKGIARSHFQGVDAIWYRVRAKAKLPDVRLHDLRHTAASVAVANGASLPMIARILGHADTKTTQRYAHLSDAPVRHVVEGLADQIAAAMSGVRARAT